MLQLSDLRIIRTKHADVLPGVVLEDEGVALVFVKANGKTFVQPSTGAAGEIFAGVSLSRSIPPLWLPKVESGIVNEDGTFTLSRAPKAGQLLVKIAGKAVEVVTTAPADATQVQQVSDMEFVAHASAIRKAVQVQYMYAPTVEEARLLIGDRPIGGVPSGVLGVVGRLQEAEFGTNYFDAAADWTDVQFAKLGAGGMFVPGTVDDHLHNVVVLNTPNSGDPFLKLDIHVA